MRALRRAKCARRSDDGESVRARPISLLRGEGLEIGPLHNPAALPAAARVRYVDKFDLDELRRRNPDVPPDKIVAPDIICDSHRLKPVPDASVDFILASHVLEHLHNPLAALLDWRRVLTSDGRILCVIPDGRYTFDRGRPLTSVDHLIWDYVNAGTRLKALSDLFHIAECNLNMHESLDRDSSIDLAKRIFDETYDTHFHVWSYASFREHLETLIRKYALPFRIDAVESDERFEFVVVLRAARGEFDLPASEWVRAAR
jgi:SAM-dependent methyltransferase